MLQWMGGSRRKVTTSRKSTQKRQKQYFEQRRRQQHQQTAELGSYEEGVNIQGQNHKEHRSLDILSLLNVSNSQECKPSCPTAREDLKVIASTLQHHITKDTPIILANAVASPDSLEVKEARTLSGYQAETLSPKNVLFSSLDNHNDAFSGIDNKPDLWKTATKQQSSFFNLLGDDGPNENLEGRLVPEAHVAFSVEGLGKVRAETPPYSPQQHDRFCSYGFSSPSKAARQLNSAKNLNYVLDDLEFEADAIMQDIDTLLSGSLEFSIAVRDTFNKLKNGLSSVGNHTQLDGHKSKMSTFGDTKKLSKTENYNEDIWDARSGLLDTIFLDERESDMSSKGWPCQMDGSSADFLKYGENEISDYAFEAPYLLKERDAMKAKEGFNILESPDLKYQTSENYFDFVIPQTARHHSVGNNFDFGYAAGQPDWSCFVTEDARDNLSLLSEESCSSTAARGEATKISPSSFKARHSRQHQNASSGPEIKGGAKTNFVKGRHFKNRGDIWKGNNACGSGKSKQMPTLSESKSAHNLNCPSQEKIGTHGSWLFEEGYRSSDMNSGFDSVCRTLGTKLPSSGSKAWTEDYFGAFPAPETRIDTKFSFDRSKHGRSAKYSPSGSFVSEKFGFCEPSGNIQCHDSPSFSKPEFGSTKSGFSPDSPHFEFKGKPLDSSHEALSHGEKLILDISAQQGVSKDEKGKSKFQENAPKENMKTMEGVHSEKRGPESKEANDGTLETSSSVKMPDKSESSVDDKEYHHDAEVPLPCQNGNEEEIENEGPGERKMKVHGASVQTP